MNGAGGNNAPWLTNLCQDLDTIKVALVNVRRRRGTMTIPPIGGASGTSLAVILALAQINIDGHPVARALAADMLLDINACG